MLQDATCANGEGNTPLHWACLNGHEEVIRALLAADATPSALNMYGRLSACMDGSHHERIACAVQFCGHIISPAIVDHDGRDSDHALASRRESCGVT